MIKRGQGKGFTMVEAVLSMAIIALIWVAAFDLFFVGAISSSIAKHKAQAIYVAQATIENMRKRPFSDIAGGTSAVSIDTKGTPDNYSDDFRGAQTVTVYNDSPYYKRVIVDIRWNETILGRSRIMHEQCGTYIANDPQAN